MMTKHQSPKQLAWNEIRAYTPLLFLHQESGTPPLLARRLWAAISQHGLNEYESDIERSNALSVLMSLAMIFQEFQNIVFELKTMLVPESMLKYLGVSHEHVKEIIELNNVAITDSSNFAKDALLLDDLVRGDVAEAIHNYFESEEDVYRLLTFQYRITEEENPYEELRTAEEMELNMFLKSHSDNKDLSLTNWHVGMDFIKSRFKRRFSY
jgi:hypothetical protein